MLPDTKVDILLATYNGARFLEQQVESVVEQLRPGWRILIRDDGSGDDTVAIIERLSARHPDCIRLIADGDQRLGASGNFARLLTHADADYVMFCDQDDVWLPSRIEKPLARIQTLETSLGRETPILVHTDLAVVDEQLRPLGPSFWKYCRIDPTTGDHLSRLLVRNVVTGCATTINRALAQLASPIPAGAAMHDWWLALVAAAAGRLEYLPEATVLYRQHSGNAIGARPWGWSDVATIVRRRLRNRANVSAEVVPLCVQARALLELMGSRLSAENRRAITALANLENRGFVRRRYEVLRHGLLKCDWVANVGWLALL